MSKLESEPVFKLIKTMSKAEKRYFKLSDSHSSEKKVIRLFDQIQKQKEYDEREILIKNPDFIPAQMPNLKAHLYKRLLKSLTAFNLVNSKDLDLRQQLNEVQLLYNKGLFIMAERKIEKVKLLARKYGKTTLLQETMDLEKEIIHYTVSVQNEEKTKRVVEETIEIARAIQNINRFSNLLVQLNAYYVKTGFIRNEKDFQSVKQFFETNLPDFQEDKLTFHEKLFLYYSYVSFYFFIQDFKSGYYYAQKYLKLFDGNEDMKTAKTEYYLRGFNNLLVAANKLGRLEEFEECYTKMLKVSKQKGIYMTENLQLQAFKYKYMHKINHYYMKGDFTGGTKIISVAENELERFSHLMDRHYVLIFYYKVACLYFGSNNFKKSLSWLNKIINSRDILIREDILIFARILSLICHFELKNDEIVEYQIKSTYRFLLKKRGLQKFFVYILDFMRNLGNEPISRKKLVNKFKDLKKVLVPLEKDKYEKRPFLYFDIISWLESRIENRPIEQIIKRKIEGKKPL